MSIPQGFKLDHYINELVETCVEAGVNVGLFSLVMNLYLCDFILNLHTMVGLRLLILYFL